ncbi:uncharacterized protein LOC134721029 isoform X3 [Mytilus trossulus]|uniref:uncharacterized protein LOC134721029 isoform X3 n=1 Tax=Mytilus trossulus TaxID=6551 RepID=UPI003007590F
MEVSLEIPCNYSSLLDLPEELVIMVLSYIPVSELLYTVCKICRGLKDVVRKMQSLWTIVEFDDSYTIDIAMMEMIVKNNQLVCLNLKHIIKWLTL